MTDPLFLAAVETVLLHEGHVSNDPRDPGGATAWGVSLRFLAALPEAQRLELADVDGDGDVDADDVVRLPRERAVEIYRRCWWERYRYAELGGVIVPTKVFDLAVNMGQRQAALCLQRALRACGGGAGVAEDGVMGPATIAAVRKANADRGMLAAIRAEAAGFYRALVAEKPARACFLKGWLNRAYH